MRYGIWRGPLPAQTYMVGRMGEPVECIVIHRMLGTLYGTDADFRSYNGTSGDVKSTHFGIGYTTQAEADADRPVIYQWVDTNDTAYGWAAIPTDIPTAAGYAVLGDYINKTDVNRPVIHIEVANYYPLPANLADWYKQPWKPNLIAKVRELVDALRGHYGAIPNLGHTDLSTKACPGSATPWAAIGGHAGALPDTSTSSEDAMLEWVAKAKPESFIATLPLGTNVRLAPKIADATLALTLPADLRVYIVGRTWGDEYPVGGDHWWLAFVHPDKGLLVVHASQITQRSSVSAECERLLDLERIRSATIKDEAMKTLFGVAITATNKANKIKEL